MANGQHQQSHVEEPRFLRVPPSPWDGWMANGESHVTDCGMANGQSHVTEVGWREYAVRQDAETECYVGWLTVFVCSTRVTQ